MGTLAQGTGAVKLSQPMNILIADDDVIATSVLEASLRRLGHEPVLAADGQAAWEAFMAKPAQVVVSDWMMPGIDGLELCRRIRARGGEYTYFILISSLDASGENLERAVEAGADDFLNKPVNPQELWSRLRVAERILNYATQVQQLHQIIPICGYCKKVRDDKNYWSQVEEYLSQQTGKSLSHGVCPECYERVLVPQMRQMGTVPPVYPVNK